MSQAPKARHAPQAIGQRGGISVLLLILLPALLFVVGVAIDATWLLRGQRERQARADSASTAAAYQLFRNQPNTAERAAWADAAGHGLVQDSSTQIEVLVPPDQGLFAGRPWHVQVRIRAPHAGFFLDRLGVADPLLRATATSGWVLRHRLCVLALSDAAPQAVLLAAKARVNANGCGLAVNASASDALTLLRDAQLQAEQIGVVGGVSLGRDASVTPTPLTQQAPWPDPLGDLAEPANGPCLAVRLRIDDTRTLAPGTYCDGITIKRHAVVTFQPGLYVLLGGGLSVENGAVVAGNDVTFFNTASAVPSYRHGVVDVASNAQVQLSAPSTGPWNGLLLVETRSVPLGQYTHRIGISDSSRWSGTLYAPRSGLALSGPSNTFANAGADHLGVIADTVSFAGQLALNMSPQRVPLGHWHQLRLLE